ncbi:hypothetical protein SUGI_0385810 [Cryptomeria japonica]|nr:hypothetical protein SUGI_0385810 [Cryptomeria japonica]
MTKEALLAKDMGGDKVRYELDKPDDLKNDPLVWNFCVEGGVANFLDCLKGHDEQLSVAFASSWSRSDYESIFCKHVFSSLL